MVNAFSGTLSARSTLNGSSAITSKNAGPRKSIYINPEELVTPFVSPSSPSLSAGGLARRLARVALASLAFDEHCWPFNVA